MNRVFVEQLSRPLHAVRESGQRNIAVGFVVAGPRAVSSEDRAIGVQKEYSEGEIVVELKQGQIQAVALHEADADELVHDFCDRGVFTSNLLVKCMAGLSRDAAEHAQQRFVEPLGRRGRFGQIVVDPCGGIPKPRAIVFHFGFAINLLSSYRSGQGSAQRDCQESRWHKKPHREIRNV